MEELRSNTQYLIRSIKIFVAYQRMRANIPSWAGTRLYRKYLAEEQINTILESHLFLKEKVDGTLKGVAVVGGNRQRYFISKEDARSPPVTTRSVLLI